MNNTITTSTELSVLQSLRSVIPPREVTFGEALRIAEIQAAKFLALLDITSFPVPSEAISELPRIRIEYVADLPTFGMSFWNGRTWIIQLSTRQSPARQRFTLFHEYKHIVDHGFARQLYRGDRRNAANVQAELVADFFAGCLLIPRRELKRAWGNGIQRLAALADYFDTSIQAIEVRLDQTGIREPMQRCQRPTSGSWRIPPQSVPNRTTTRTA